MMASSVEVQYDRFEEIRQRLGDTLAALVETTSEEIVAEIKASDHLPKGAPVTVTRGAKTNTIKVGDRRRFFVGFVEYGTIHQTARPFVTPIAESNRARFEGEARRIEPKLA
jgi:hypothetical protein